MVVADISDESANETVGSLQSDLRGQGHMAAVVDVSSKESVKKLVTSIQVSGSLFSQVALEWELHRPILGGKLDIFYTP